MGALAFTAGVILALVLATYLIQAALLALQAVVVAAILLARVVLVTAGAVIWCGWWLFRREEAMLAWRAAAG